MIRPPQTLRKTRGRVPGDNPFCWFTLFRFYTLGFGCAYPLLRQAARTIGTPGERGSRKTLEAKHPIFVVADYHASTGNHYRSADQVWIFGHQGDCLPAGGWIVLHLLSLKESASRPQKILVIVRADEFREFGRAQRVFHDIAVFELIAALLKKVPRLFAGRARWLLKKFQSGLGFRRSSSGPLRRSLRHDRISSFALSSSIHAIQWTDTSDGHYG